MLSDSMALSGKAARARSFANHAAGGSASLGLQQAHADVQRDMQHRGYCSQEWCTFSAY